MFSKQELIDIDLELDLLRGSVDLPDTHILKTSILSETRTLPQKLNVETVDLVSSSNVENKVRRWFGARLLAGAVCMAILVVTASILLPNDSTPVFVTDILSSDELEMQELMLLQDEILFSQL